MRNPLIAIVLVIFPLALVMPSEGTQNKSLPERIGELERRVLALEFQVAALKAPPVSGYRPVGAKKWKDVTNWRKLQIGMGSAEVRELMGGDPDKIARISNDLEIWYFGYPGGALIRL
ncbi:MAG: hypothetical protein ABIS67_06620, partial [Candidatus Eisenbacteria bacterium]